MTNKQKMLAAYPLSICAVLYPPPINVYQIIDENYRPLGPKCSLPKYAWKYAWEQIQKTMIEQLEA